MKTTGVRSWNALLSRISKRVILRNCSSDAYSKRDNENKTEGDLNKFFGDESPLKHYKDYSKWITSPYPEGSLVRSAKERTENRIDPSFTNIIMFPGQGGQYIGMGKKLLEFPAVVDMFEAASEILKYNLKKLCLKGPLRKLNKTEHCQPATVVCSLAALEKLKYEIPNVFDNCVCTCGFSLGEITSLIFAGSISFEDGIRITKVRAEAMQACSEAVASGMMTILYGSDSDIKTALKDAKSYCIEKGINNGLCEVANYISPEIKVIAGHKEALEYITDWQRKYKIRKTSKLLVSGAFHTTLMMDAVKPLQAIIDNVKLEDPSVPVVSNITGKSYRDAISIRKNLSKQIYSPVKWEQVIDFIYGRTKGTNFPSTYICGPGMSLKVIMNRINAKAAKKCYVVF